MRYLLAILAALLVGLAVAPGAQAGLIAPKGTCHNARNADAGHRGKRHALRCLVRYAREHAGRRGLAGNRRLHHSTVRKSYAISRCGFTHTPCGRPFGSFARGAGYCATGSSWRLGENLAHGYSTARAAMKAWLASPEHRANILGAWSSIGTSIRGSGLWVVQFGSCT